MCEEAVYVHSAPLREKMLYSEKRSVSFAGPSQKDIFDQSHKGAIKINEIYFGKIIEIFKW